MYEILDMPGPNFLAFYGMCLAIAVVLGLIVPRWLKPQGRETMVSDPDQLAYLAGGSSRFAETVVARLLAREELSVAGKGFVIATPGGGRSAAERDVLRLQGSPDWSKVAGAAMRHAAPIERQLIDAGLMMEAGTAWQMRVWQTVPYALVIALGVAKWSVGVARDKPVELLTILLIATLVLALIRFFVVDRTTRAGKRVLKQARTQSDRLRRAPTAPETDTAVALFGTAVLAGSGFAAFDMMRRSSGSDGGGSSGCSSDSGGGGCSGGSGCGGCGGD